MNAWIGIIGTVVGGLLAGMAAWLNSRSQLRRQEERDRKKLFLSKLEELYLTITEFSESYSKFTMSKVQILTKRTPLDVSDVRPRPINDNQLRMLVGFYAPELEPQLKQLLTDWAAAYVWFLELTPETISADDFQRNLFIVNQRSQEMCQEIIALSKKYI